MKLRLVSLLPGILSVICLVSVFALWMETSKKPEVVYVHNDRLILEFIGFKENQAEYQAMTKMMQSNLDSLSADFNQEVQAYLTQKATYSKDQQVAKEAFLKQQEVEVVRYRQAIEQKALEKEQLMNEAILKQINSLVKEYAVAHNYEAVIGVTENGNVLYAKENKDITDQVVKFINNKYEGN